MQVNSCLVDYVAINAMENYFRKYTEVFRDKIGNLRLKI